MPLTLTIHILGLELVTLTIDTDTADDTDLSLGGAVTATPIGFTPTPDTPREDPGTDYDQH